MHPYAELSILLLNFVQKVHLYFESLNTTGKYVHIDHYKKIFLHSCYLSFIARCTGTHYVSFSNQPKSAVVVSNMKDSNRIFDMVTPLEHL